MTKDECSVKDLFQKAQSAYDVNDVNGVKQTWWIYAAFTDHLLLDKWTSDWEEATKENKIKADLLLELRVFCKDAEYRLIRGNIGSDLMRQICDKDSQLAEYLDYYDEWQYLDIDTMTIKEKDDSHCFVRATGGGKYKIPFSKKELEDVDEKTRKRFIDGLGVKIRNYLSYYEETGQAYVSDWRMVELGGIE